MKLSRRLLYNLASAGSTLLPNISSMDLTQFLQIIEETYNIKKDDVLNDMNKKKRETIFTQHKQHYSVFQDKKDNRWKTTVPDKTKKSGRRLIAKRNYDDLVTAVANFYASEETGNQFDSLTLRTAFAEWLHFKSIHGASAYSRRILNDWNKYYLNDDIIDVPIRNLDRLTLDNWIHNLILSNNMTKKQYSNASIIIRQVLEFVCLKYPNQMQTNPFSGIKVNPKIYTYKNKPADNTQIFTVDEENSLCTLALETAQQYGYAISSLAIALNFHLGLRAGELVSLRWSDIIKNGDDFFIHIQRMQVADYKTLEDGKVISNKTKILNRTKSPAGDRWLYLTSRAKEILEITQERNRQYGLLDTDYIFVNLQGEPIKASSINGALYKLCARLGIPKRSSHKVRKTYLTELFENGMSVNEICRIAGHEDEKTFFRNYCFNRKTHTETITLLENISKCKHA